MIAIDTNVLLRYLLQDETAQAEKANALLSGINDVLITDIVLTETVWTLKGKRYGLSKEQISDIIYALFAEPRVIFEDAQAVWAALRDFDNAVVLKVSGKAKQADFPDALIVNKAKRFGQLNHKQDIPVYTFDKAALSISGTRHP